MTRALIALIALLCMGSAAANEDSLPPQRKLLGFVEQMTLEPAGLRLKARLDTGAQTSSLHSIETEAFKRDGKEWVRFHVPIEEQDAEGDEGRVRALVLERPVKRTVLIKRKGAPSQRRYVVELPFCFDGQHYETEFSLTDRTAFMYPALLGRQFLKDVAVVDPAQSFLAKNACEYTQEEQLTENVLEFVTDDSQPADMAEDVE